MQCLTKNKNEFIGKESDFESSLGDFCVRKYDEEIGRFTSIDPLWEKYLGWSPYHYCGNNPIMSLDPSGNLVFASGSDVDCGLEEMNKHISFQLQKNSETGLLYVDEGTKVSSEAEMTILEALQNPNVCLDLNFTTDNVGKTIDGKPQPIIGGLFGESKINSDGTVEGLQIINVGHFKSVFDFGIHFDSKPMADPPGQNIIHEFLEGYVAARDYAGQKYKQAYQNSHNSSMNLYPLYGSFVAEAKFNFQKELIIEVNKTRLYKLSSEITNSLSR